MKEEIKDCNKELVKAQKIVKTDLNFSEIEKKSSTDLEKRAKRLE